MLDPLSALSVAASVIQFLDFGCKIVGTSLDIHKSKGGATEHNLETAAIAADLQSLSNKLKDASDINSDGWSESEKKMQDMAIRCHETAKLLCSTLRKLQKNEKSRFKSWDTLRVAIKSVHKRGEIEALQRRLDSMRSQLTIHLLNILQ
jgi:hypothetical protein